MPFQSCLFRSLGLCQFTDLDPAHRCRGHIRCFKCTIAIIFPYTDVVLQVSPPGVLCSTAHACLPEAVAGPDAIFAV